MLLASQQIIIYYLRMTYTDTATPFVDLHLQPRPGGTPTSRLWISIMRITGCVFGAAQAIAGITVLVYAMNAADTASSLMNNPLGQLTGLTSATNGFLSYHLWGIALVITIPAVAMGAATVAATMVLSSLAEDNRHSRNMIDMKLSGPNPMVTWPATHAPSPA